MTFTPTDPANVASASAAVAISVVSSGSGTTPTPVKIGTTIAGSWKDATGHSGQSHLVFSPNTNRWWLFTLSSAHDSAGDRTVRTYVSSGPDLATATWTATASSPTLGNTGGATSSLLAGGRSLGVALRTIGTTDYVHVFVSAAFDGQVSSNGHARAQLGAGSITWSAWNNPGSPNAASEWQGPPGTGPTGLPSHTPWGNSVGISTGGFIHHFSTTMDQEVDCAVGRSTNADTAASWVNGFGANTSPTGRAGTSPPWTTAVIDKTMANECKVLAFAPLASDVMLAVYGNGATLQPQITNLRYQRSGNAGAWTNIPVSGGGDGNVFGTTATIDQNDWALVSLSTTVIYTFRAKSVGTGVDGVVYNTGTNNWSAVLSAPPLFGTGQSFKSGGGLFGATDGANVWLFAINNSDAANSILFTKFNGLSWTPWAAVPGTSTGTHTRNFITGYRTVSSNQIGLAWTEGSTSVDVFTTSLSMGAAGPSPVTATLSAPTNGSTLSGATTLSASASSTAGTIAGVQFKLDGANLGAEDTTSPYSVSWDITTASVGTHFLSAVARDITGATGFTNTVSVTVTNDTTPPAVSMIAPATGATVSGTSVVVAADASDDVGVVGVQFLLDGAALGTEVTTAPYAINWNPTTATSGTHTLSARARDAAGRTTVSASISVSIPANKVTPTITWAAPAAIPYGTPLGAAQFNATASVPGSFVYSPAVGTVLPVGGGQPLSVSFTPTDTTTYTTAAANVSIMVTKGTPGITWPAPASIFYGTPLGALQLNASASVPGTFAYTPATGTLLSAGAAQTLSVTFMPADVTNYGPVTRTVAIDVFKATPTITWAAPSPIPFGTLLSSAQLNATADVRGTFTYSPPAGAVLSPGVQTLTVTFTPADTENYTIPASKSVSLTVAKGTPDISWPEPAAMVYGSALGGTELNATSTVPGTFAFAPAAGTVLPAGVNTLSVTFTPTDPASYNSATSSVTITVNKASPTITWRASGDHVWDGTLGNAVECHGGAPDRGKLCLHVERDPRTRAAPERGELHADRGVYAECAGQYELRERDKDGDPYRDEGEPSDYVAGAGRDHLRHRPEPDRSAECDDHSRGRGRLCLCGERYGGRWAAAHRRDLHDHRGLHPQRRCELHHGDGDEVDHGDEGDASDYVAGAGRDHLRHGTERFATERHGGWGACRELCLHAGRRTGTECRDTATVGDVYADGHC